MPLVTATTPGSPGASTVLPSQASAEVYHFAPVSRQYQQEGGMMFPIQSLFQQLQRHHGVNWSSDTTKSSCIKSRHLFIFLITLLLPFFSPLLQNLKAGLLSQFDYKISVAIQANLPWESSQTLLVYNRYDEREKQNTNALVVAMI